MRLASLFFLSSTALWAFPNGYTYCKVMTTLHAMVSGSSDLTNYPLTVIFTDNDFKTTGNGGLVNNSSGFDIGFGPDCSGSAANLKWEMEKYVPTTGAVVAHLLRPTFSHTVDDTVGVYYGGAQSSFQGGASSAIFNPVYSAVWHLGEATNATANDSAASFNSTTNQATNVAGIVGDGQQLVAASSDTIVWPQVWAIQGDYTMSGWINAAATTAAVVLEGRRGDFVGPLLYTTATDGLAHSFINPPSTQTTGAVAADSTWHMVSVTRSGTTSTLYVDANAGVTLVQSPASTDFSNWRLGADVQPVFYSSKNDEVRLAPAALSGDWLVTQYNNQSAPATYISLGARQGGSTMVVRKRAWIR